MAGTTPHVYNLSAIVEGKVPQRLYGGVFRLNRHEREEFIKIFESASRFESSENQDLYSGQKLGDCLTQPTPWETTQDGNAVSIGITLSGIVAADITSLEVTPV